MKKHIPAFCIALLFVVVTACTRVNDAAPGSKKIVLAPLNNPYETSVAIYNGADASNHLSPEEPLCAWTIGGLPITIRNLLKFDISKIPATGSIESARLILNADSIPLNGDLVHANYGTDNSIVIQQVAEPWDTSTVTWFNQPGALSANQVIVPNTFQPFGNLDVDVKAMVSAMVSSGKNYGFKLSLRNEVIYTSRILCSSYYPDTSRRPKLMITYK
ncbi:MAG: DNRLRE domain-containing protein [Mucilaginibacter sp.]